MRFPPPTPRIVEVPVLLGFGTQCRSSALARLQCWWVLPGHHREVPRFAWTYEEVVLAADLVAKNNWRGLRAGNPLVVELSDLLRSASFHDLGDRPENFRSPSSVQRKTFDIATQHPDYPGKATRGGPFDARVLVAFLETPERMADVAAEIRNRIDLGIVQAPGLDPEVEVLAAFEGRAQAVHHLSRERDPRLRRSKLRAVRAEGRDIDCEVCGFDFEVVYGGLGEGFIEVHHVRPLHDSGPVVTRLEDLVLLCSNCHRMIHRARPWIWPAQLRGRLRGSV